MNINSLNVRNFRNIESSEIEPYEKINLILGENGSGKTSLLESIYILSRGKSFRSPNLNEAIEFKTKSFIIFGKIDSGIKRKQTIAFRKTKDNSQVKIDGKWEKDRAVLARIMPIQIIYPGSFRILEEGPSNRRRFLDYGLFHVEQSFLSIWKSYSRALRQRNALLRTGNSNDINSWDRELVRYGSLLNEKRKDYLASFENFFLRDGMGSLPFDNISFKYFNGWSKDKTLEETLVSNFAKDQQIGFTRYGPHRSDFSIFVDNQDAKRYLSRGQIKKLVISLKIVQAKMLDALNDQGSCILIDDLGSELDEKSVSMVADELKNLNMQVFVTTTKSKLLAAIFKHHRTFHVEHGQILIN